MEIYEASETLLTLKTDLRAEAAARELAEAGIVAIENVLLVPGGAFNRSGSRDILSITEENRDSETQLHYAKMRTSREGISDMLPPGIIFQPTINRGERSTEVVLEDIEYYETGISHARTFFSPFDLEFGKQRAALEMHNHHSVTNPFAHYQETLFAYLWPDLDLDFSPEQKEAVLELTIHAHLIVGDFSACKVYFETILGQEITLETGRTTWRKSSDMDFLQPLGSSILGVDWISHGQCSDPDYVEILIGPVPDDSLSHFRSHEPKGKNYMILEFLCGLLLPAEMSWNMTLTAEKGFFTINKTRETGILGYSTIL
jgi:hypothetical protein